MGHLEFSVPLSLKFIFNVKIGERVKLDDNDRVGQESVKDHLQFDNHNGQQRGEWRRFSCYIAS